MDNEGQPASAKFRVMYEQVRKAGSNSDSKMSWGIFSLKPYDNETYESMVKSDPSLKDGYNGKELISAKGMYANSIVKGSVIEAEYETVVPQGHDKAQLKILKAVPVGFTNKATTMAFLSELEAISALLSDEDDMDERSEFIHSLYDAVRKKKEDLMTLTVDDIKAMKGIELDDASAAALLANITSEFATLQETEKRSDARSLYLQDIGCEKELADKMSVYLDKKGISMDNLRANPFIVCNEGLISFKEFDTMWESNPRYNKTDSNRILAAICAAPAVAGSWSGDTLHDEWTIMNKACEVSGLGVSGKRIVEKHIKQAIDEGYLQGYRFTHKGRKKMWYQDYRTYEKEVFIANKLKTLINNSSKLEGDVKLDIDENADASQAAAIRGVVMGNNGVAIITGGPGHGKTWTVKSVVENMKKVAQDTGKELEVVGMTPTGISAERLADAMGEDASTIHRKLGAMGDDGEWLHNDENRVKGDVFVIDEAFMKDVDLMYRTLLALPDDAKVIFLGDKDQLLPVGQGQPVLDIMMSKIAPTYILDTNHRTGDGAGISKVATGIMDGEMPTDEHDDFDLKITENAKDSKLEMYRSVLRYASSAGEKALTESQVLLPQRKGLMGTRELNPLLRMAYRPELGKSPIAYGSDNVPEKHIETYGNGLIPEIILEGDKVMQTRNCKETDTRNGALGTVAAIYKNGSMVVDMHDGRRITFQANKAKGFELGYAVTVNKAQGIGVANAFVALDSKYHQHMLNRNIVYTGVTRASEKCILIGDQSGIEKAVNTTPEPRLSGLRFTCTLAARGKEREMPHRDFYKPEMSIEQEQEIANTQMKAKEEADKLMAEALAESDWE